MQRGYPSERLRIGRLQNLIKNRFDKSIKQQLAYHSHCPVLNLSDHEDAVDGNVNCLGNPGVDLEPLDVTMESEELSLEVRIEREHTIPYFFTEISLADQNSPAGSDWMFSELESSCP